MPVKKSKPRTATSQRRIKKYAETYRSKTVPLWFKKVAPKMATLLEDWLTNQDELEKQIFAQLDADGFIGEVQLYYAAFARRLFSTCLRFWDATYEKEKTSLKTEFQLRGLDSAELEKLIAIVDSKCAVVRSVVVTLQDIEDKLDNASHGLVALKALLDAVEGKLDDATYGLSALKVAIDAIEGKLDNATYGLNALDQDLTLILGRVEDVHFSVIDIEDKLDNATYGLAALQALLLRTLKYTTQAIAIYPYAAAFPSATSGVGAWNWGAWVQIVPADTLPDDCIITGIYVRVGDETISREFQVEIGLGDVGGESPVARIAGYWGYASSHGGFMTQRYYPFPTPIVLPANTRVAFRCVDDNAAARTYRCGINYVPLPL